MLSKTLIKLVDEAIVPAFTLVAAKILSTVIVNGALNLTWDVKGLGLVYYSMPEFLKANSYSSLVMFFVILLFTLWVAFKSHVLHDSHVHPHTSVRLVSLNLPYLIQSSFELYSQATVWLSYSWLTTIILGVMLFSGLIYGWVFYVALGLTLFTTLALILDIERDLVIKKEDSLDLVQSYA